MKHIICIEILIGLDETEKIINYVDQGWHLHELLDNHSLTIKATREFEVECDCIESYIKALETCPEFRVVWYDSMTK